MTDSKQHLIDMVVECTVNAMDWKDLVAFVEEMLYREYESWSEPDLKSYLNENWPLDE